MPAIKAVDLAKESGPLRISTTAGVGELSVVNFPAMYPQVGWDQHLLGGTKATGTIRPNPITEREKSSLGEGNHLPEAMTWIGVDGLSNDQKVYFMRRSKVSSISLGV